ncbi:MAG: adenosylcobinamide-GDP ribazoletransferase [Nitrososphaerota archaeon]|jgi:adenosylcobinamide-GDP ribazoletransferase|uniref:adenosylcobinamide-GDP ribazoletransferase n=1 Tax=Candidatus Bathycorpusculum sp. TaxID=2994959 RepID=UPI00282D7627|nr:adenosylcobinamide-GDP ribazoletransferase [Candidatus Termitimicrobium sp.]MCL2431191.1 adenosylcobinamide-GDP ribazoletransferase [Candidatus Termitimicrobium sp.]MDR0492317.1 adenosylcobinamide-GDP ribazoletransferase [Nitrososphaerota archaeon]
MSPLRAGKVFKDLLSFLTIIPLGGKEDFIFTTASNMWLFPVVGGFIGLLGGLYYILASTITTFLLNIANIYVALPMAFLGSAIPAAMTIAFLLVLTGLQHFDGLIDLGNALGLRNLHDRKMKAHAWTVTYAGAVLALSIEFIAVAGLILVSPLFAFTAVILAEVSAKLAMVTIVWIGKPSHKGLGSIFLAKAKKPQNIIAYLLSALIVYPVFYFTGYAMLGLAATSLMIISVPVALVMSRVSNHVFGGVSGDMIGATNETTRAITLILFALLLTGVTG